MSAPSFFSELKRRQIYRGGVMYVVAGWVIVQVVTTVFPYFDIPSWAIRLVVVAIMLGFPIALVALWMFESTLPNDPETRLHDRRQGSRDTTDALAKLMEAERSERARETQELIAALAQLKGEQPPAHAASNADPSVAEAPIAMETLRSRLADAPAAAPAVVTVQPIRKRRSRVALLMGLAALCIVLSGIWTLVVPQATFQPAAAAAASGQLAEKYVAPGFNQLEDIGVFMLTPLLDKLGIQMAPERVFTILLAIAGFLVLRGFYRQITRLRTRHARQS